MMLHSINEWVRVSAFAAIGEGTTRIYGLIEDGKLKAKRFQGVVYVNVRSWNDLIETEGEDVQAAQEQPQGRPRRQRPAAPKRPVESEGHGGRKLRLRTHVRDEAEGA